MPTKGQKRTPASERKEWPLAIYGWMIGFGFGGYFLGMFIFGETSHPLHWASGLLGLILGCWVGWILVYWKDFRLRRAAKR